MRSVDIEKLSFFRDCSPETVRDFLRLGRIVRHPKGQVVLRAREKNPEIFFVLSGKVQIYNLTGDGRKKILFILGSNNIANDSIIKGYSAIFCETLEECVFLAIRREDLTPLMQRDFTLTAALMEYQERRMWRLEHQLKNTFGSIYIERKLASKLWRLARDFGIETERGVLIDVELSITFLADLLGVPRENASRACKKLSDLGIIAIDRKRIYVVDRDRTAYYFQHGELPE